MPSSVHTPICIQHDLPISASVWEKVSAFPEKRSGAIRKGRKPAGRYAGTVSRAVLALLGDEI